jgi:hypothetical protein
MNGARKDSPLRRQSGSADAEKTCTTSLGIQLWQTFLSEATTALEVREALVCGR